MSCHPLPYGFAFSHRPALLDQIRGFRFHQYVDVPSFVTSAVPLLGLDADPPQAIVLDLATVAGTLGLYQAAEVTAATARILALTRHWLTLLRTTPELTQVPVMLVNNGLPLADLTPLVTLFEATLLAGEHTAANLQAMLATLPGRRSSA